MVRFGRAGVGPDGALVDPLADRLNRGRGKWLGVGDRRGHPLVGVGGRDAANDFTRFALAGDEQRSRIATLQGSLAQVEPQSAFLLVGSVTLIAVLGQERLHGRDKIDQRGLGGRGQGRGREGRNQPTQQSATGEFTAGHEGDLWGMEAGRFRSIKGS
jgi:hypothetical protein